MICSSLSVIMFGDNNSFVFTANLKRISSALFQWQQYSISRQGSSPHSWSQQRTFYLISFLFSWELFTTMHDSHTSVWQVDIQFVCRGDSLWSTVNFFWIGKRTWHNSRMSFTNWSLTLKSVPFSSLPQLLTNSFCVKFSNLARMVSTGMVFHSFPAQVVNTMKRDVF